MEFNNPGPEVYFADEKNCLREIGEARKAFNTNTTWDQFENLIKALGIMYLYCPEDIQYIVEATIQETATRQVYAVGK